jgi:hypothetical protein
MKVIDAIIDLQTKAEEMGVRFTGCEVDESVYDSIISELHGGFKGPSKPPPGDPPKHMGELLGMSLYLRAPPTRERALASKIRKATRIGSVNDAFNAIVDYLEGRT